MEVMPPVRSWPVTGGWLANPIKQECNLLRAHCCQQLFNYSKRMRPTRLF